MENPMKKAIKNSHDIPIYSHTIFPYDNPILPSSFWAFLRAFLMAKNGTPHPMIFPNYNPITPHYQRVDQISCRLSCADCSFVGMGNLQETHLATYHRDSLYDSFQQSITYDDVDTPAQYIYIYMYIYIDNII